MGPSLKPHLLWGYKLILGKAIPENILDSFRAKTALHRRGQPEELTNVYAFLSSDEAAFVTGTTISVDNRGADLRLVQHSQVDRRKTIIDLRQGTNRK